MRARSKVGACLGGLVGALALAGPAAALEIGPISLGGTTPTTSATAPADAAPTTAPPLLTVGSVTVPSAGLLPGLGVSVDPSPDGTTIGVSLPTSIGPVPLPSGTLQGAQVSLGSGGTAITPDAGPTGAGAPAPERGSASVSAPPLAHSAPGNAAGTSPVASNAPAAAGRHAPAIPTATTPDAVNASLRHVAPHGGWSFVRELTSPRVLWLALVAIMLVGRWALVGLVRDARRNARVVTAG